MLFYFCSLCRSLFQKAVYLKSVISVYHVLANIFRFFIIRLFFILIVHDGVFVICYLFRLALLCLGILALPGCLYQSDDQILENAQHCYQQVSLRYEELLDTPDDEKIIALARDLGTTSYAEKKGWFDWMFRSNSFSREATPLHAVARFIEDDIDSVNGHLGGLGGRLLVNIPLYRRLESMRDGLMSVLKIIKTDADYREESRFLEMRRIEADRLDEERRQRELLEKLAESPKEKIVYKEVSTGKLHKKEFAEIVVV